MEPKEHVVRDAVHQNLFKIGHDAEVHQIDPCRVSAEHRIDKIENDKTESDPKGAGGSFKL